jgi:predicted DNA-binding transcriptional regulator YafY
VEKQMPVNKNALIRYKTIDKCLQNRCRRWSLDDLIEACSDALYEYEGLADGVGKRTIQADIQMMRSDELGYNAPIVVVDRKYYTYADPEYSIMKKPLSMHDLEKLEEVTEILGQFRGFTYFNDLNVLVQKLEDKVDAEKKDAKQVIDMEKNENLKGLDYLDPVYQAIRSRQVLNIWYQSFKAKRAGKIVFHPYLLKEYRNRWFVLGRKDGKHALMTLALDRISELEENNEESYVDDPDFNSDEYFKDTIGVTVNSNRPVDLYLLIDHENSPYVLTKPLHHSQQIIGEYDNGVEIVIKVIPSLELEREILGFGEGIQVLSPMSFRTRIQQRLAKAINLYS